MRKPKGNFPCKCGFTANNGEEFSDHVHAVGSVKPCPEPIEWQPTTDWLEARAKAGN